METFDLTPDPKVLIALTHTPMQPLDALCDPTIVSIRAKEVFRLSQPIPEINTENNYRD